MEKRSRRRFNEKVPWWIILGEIVLIIAFVIHLAMGEDTQPEPEPIVETTEQEFVVYGAPDDRCFVEEVPLKWEGDEPFKSVDCELDPELQEFTFYLCKSYNIDFTLAMAIMHTESTFNPSVVSSTNDYGLMQINKVNHEWITEAIGVTNYLDPHENIRAGLFVLRKLFEKYETSEKVLMAYHFGEGGASSLWKQGINDCEYSRTILEKQKEYDEVLNHMDK